jgi:mitochondrial inner membrane protein COX18
MALVWAPVHGAELFFVGLHAATGAPWWAVVAGGAVLLRATLTLPIAVYQARNAARLELDAGPYVAAWRDKLAVALRAEYRAAQRPYEEFQRELAKRLRRQAWQVYRTHRCHPLGPALAPLAQVPLWVAVSLALRRSCASAAQGSTDGRGTTGSLEADGEGTLSTTAADAAGAVATATAGHGGDEGMVHALLREGLPWCVDLTAPDPTWLLPCAVGALHLANLGVRTLASRGGPPTPLQRGVTYALQAGSVGLVLAAAQLPSVRPARCSRYRAPVLSTCVRVCVCVCM